MTGIKAGFTGELDDRTGAGAVARRAAATVQQEAGAVAAAASDHRAATGSALLVVGALAFFAGYLAGTGRDRTVAPRDRLRGWFGD